MELGDAVLEDVAVLGDVEYVQGHIHYDLDEPQLQQVLPEIYCFSALDIAALE